MLQYQYLYLPNRNLGFDINIYTHTPMALVMGDKQQGRSTKTVLSHKLVHSKGL